MKFQPDDPKLTAYALGELDAREAAAVAAAVENSTECRQTVEETRETAGMLKSALQTETCPALSADQRAVIEAALAGGIVAAVSDRRDSSPVQRPAVGDRRYSSTPAQPSFWVAMLRWRPQFSTVVVWATACLVAVTGWALWLEVFRKSGRDSNRQVTEFAIKLNPKPATPQPPPPLWAVNQLAAQTVIPPLPLVHLTLTNVVSGSSNGTCVFTGGGLDVSKNIFTLGSGAGTQTTGSSLAKNGPIGYWFNGNSAVTFNGNLLQISGTTANSPSDSSDASLDKLGTNTLILAGNNTYSGGVILGAGRLGYSGATIINAGTLQLKGGTLQLGGASGSYSKGASFALTKNGAGTLTPVGSIAYSGPVYINQGTLVLANDGLNGAIGSRVYAPPPGTESYTHIRDNPFLAVAEHPLSTFSTDVDTASYANVRRFLTQGLLPPRDAVRIEEMINYFTYDYAKPKRGEPFSVNIEAAGCPWNPEHRLVRIGLKGREVTAAKRPPCNLVFLIDVSGSMGDANKLLLVKPAIRMLVEQLTENERVAIVVYSDTARVVLSSTSGDRRQEIIDAIESLQAGGCTNGGDGIRQAYDMATRHFIERGVNRVILCTDGDFNVGTTELADLTRLIEQKRKSGVFLSVLGFGAGNLKDATLERLADKGNGHYTYIDTFFEARKVLVEQMSGTLVTIAKDVKIQVEFNPAKVAGYRLIGYENRLLRKEDFNNDRKDAGEIGAGHTVTALYEIVPAGQSLPTPPVDALKYQPSPKPVTPVSTSDDLLTVKLRYKQPDGDKSALIEQALTDSGKGYAAASRDFKFAAAVAAFGMVLRDSEHKGNATLAGVLELAEEGRGPDASGYRTEFLSLVKKAQKLGKR